MLLGQENSYKEKWFIGKPPRIPAGPKGVYLHVGSAVQSTVVFLGFRDNQRQGGIACQGTGFLFHYDGAGYLVTVRHVAEIIDDHPFVVRLNKSGKAVLMDFDKVTWFMPQDDTVDLAITPLELTVGHGYECQYLTDDAVMMPNRISGRDIDIGDICYTVGLFKNFYGEQRNLPLLFTGNVSLFPPEGERIPCWNAQKGRIEKAEAYLIESHAIKGASGSPVFVRAAYRAEGLLRDHTPLFADGEVKLMGIFHGAWFAPPDPDVANTVNAKAADTVPVGLGIVTPAAKLMELLQRKDIKGLRDKNPKVKTMTAQQARDMEKKYGPKATPENTRPGVEANANNAPQAQEDPKEKTR